MTSYADELFNLTGELQASNKELARATRYFYEEESKKRKKTSDNADDIDNDDEGTSVITKKRNISGIKIKFICLV